MLCSLCSIHSIVFEIVSTISSYKKRSPSKNAIANGHANANENGQLRQTVDKNGPILSKSTQFASDTNKSVLYTLGLGYIGNNNTRYYNYQSTTTNIEWFSQRIQLIAFINTSNLNAEFCKWKKGTRKRDTEQEKDIEREEEKREMEWGGAALLATDGAWYQSHKTTQLRKQKKRMNWPLGVGKGVVSCVGTAVE